MDKELESSRLNYGAYPLADALLRTNIAFRPSAAFPPLPHVVNVYPSRMLEIIKRIFTASWAHYVARLLWAWKSRLTHVFSRDSSSPFNLRPLTEQQHKSKVDEFVESIDTDAICTLASKYTGGLPCTIRCRQQGSFNVCFILDFPDNLTRIVRLPIEPAVHDVWDKVCSEVCTMQYVRDHTNIPIPRVYAYGRSRLRHNTLARQVFIVSDYMDGKSLTKRMLRDSPEDFRRRFFGDIVDIFAQLRRIEFPQGGSLMPNAAVGIWPQFFTSIFHREEAFTPQSATDHRFGPKIAGAISMRRNELQIDGYTSPPSAFTTANDFFREQYQLLQYMWKMPSQELGREEAERDEFALHALSLEEAQNISGLKTDPSGDSFYLSHPDLRVNNIIVDDELCIRGIIDWEFSVTVPRYAFLPPSWLTGHDTGSIISRVDVSSEFMSVLSSKKHESHSHSQLAQDWSFQDDLRLPMAYIFLDPSDLVFIFYRYIYPRLYKKPRNEVLPLFFQLSENKDLQAGIERRLDASQRYTQYLKDHNLVDDNETSELQQIRQWTADTQKTLEQLSKWSDETQDKLARLDRERPMQFEQGKQV
ncbi:hypothetical protein FPOAC1_000050 [Fusarium poae]|uniref:hypothetical protein n=1 Tax=Fusarium poae TaxID=36050 RepID=UPI001CEBD22B|nr:hypothetical protein FPOAC1_000050 [Fusarium poae]KAG8674087.1 hypothetical protein FPOAC1_000050 [Fusarium poae]